jgi:hypothetical protein
MSMKKVISVRFPVMSLAIFVLIAASVNEVCARKIEMFAEPVGVFLNGRQVNLSKDSLQITTTGSLSLSALYPAYKDAEKVRFKVVIRHFTYAGELLLLTLDERYMDGKEFDSVDVESILSKAKVGDQILIIPSDKDGKFENTREPFVLNIISDRC